MDIQKEIKNAFCDGREQERHYLNGLRENEPQSPSSYYRKWKIKREDETIKQWLERIGMKDSFEYKSIKE
jgi:hypothetical protein